MASRKPTRRNSPRRPAQKPRSKPTSTSSPDLQGEVLPLTLGKSGVEVKAQGRRYLVSAAVPGDKIYLETFRGREEPYPARMKGLASPSEDRTTPPCTLLNKCGGCSIQAMHYKSQLKEKRRALVELLSPLCSEDKIGSVQGLKSAFGYRTRLMMPAVPTRSGFKLGFYQRGTTNLISAPGCPVQHPLTLATAAMVNQILQSSSISATEPRSEKGWLHGLCVRTDPTSGQSEVVLIGRSAKLPIASTYIDRIAALPGVSGVHISVNPTRSSYLYGDKFVHLAGKKRTAFTLGGQEFHLSPGSFFQTSAEGAEALVETALRLLPDHSRTLADLYGGVGVFARLSAAKRKKAIVTESNPHANSDLRAYLKHTKDRSILSIPGQVEDVIDRVLSKSPDTILVDPPRSGCHARVIQSLVRHQPQTILYVACGVEALVRDASLLLEGGYTVERVEAVDMFPHTNHLEVVALLRAPEMEINE